ncbi:MAG: gliding motility-associated C-terminal domain-containing protein [Lewinella sp.]|nr:gliding motility-associated C-terminal domain-containing protein [Lewinella sp.]
MKRSAFLFFACLLSLGIRAQTQQCNGDLGENIFADGDFGSGLVNILPNDPGIAPGYSYTTNPPPADGSYLITANMALWNSIYGDWHQPSDNSDNPNGYMMVVNASYEPGVFYTQTVDGLCENTLYEFSADVINLDRLGLTGRIAPNVSFLINNVVLYGTGNVPNDEDWHTYGFTFMTGPGEESVVLSLVNNAPGGLGNDLALDNISFRPCGPQVNLYPIAEDFVCEDDPPLTMTTEVIGGSVAEPSLQWQISYDEGSSWQDLPGATAETHQHNNQASGVYWYRVLVGNNTSSVQNPYCRTISPVKVVRVIPKNYAVVDTLCMGLSYPLGNQSYDQTGIYTDTLISSRGCDSIVTLDLTILPEPGITVEITAEPVSCSDAQDGGLTLTNITHATPPWLITFNQGPPGTESSWSFLPPGDYSFGLTDYFGCTWAGQATLATPPPFTIELGPDHQPLLGETVTLTPSGSLPVSTYNWEPAGLIDCMTNCATVTFTPLQSVQLMLTAVSEFGCVATDSVAIEVDVTAAVYLPNIFSPNDDGVNDRFLPLGVSPAIEEVEAFQVFDRWGTLLHEEKGIPFAGFRGWDGKVAGEPAPTGTYVYLLELRLIDGQRQTLSGGVTLLR